MRARAKVSEGSSTHYINMVSCCVPNTYWSKWGHVHTRQSYQLVTDERRGVVCVLLQCCVSPASEIFLHLVVAAPSVVLREEGYRVLCWGSEYYYGQLSACSVVNQP